MAVSREASSSTEGRIKFAPGVRWGKCPEQIFEDTRLRPVARVVAGWLAVKPPNWIIKIEYMRSCLKIKPTAWKSAKRDLTDAGYLQGERLRNEKGQLDGWNYTFNPTPPMGATQVGQTTSGKNHRRSNPKVAKTPLNTNSIGTSRKTTTTQENVARTTNGSGLDSGPHQAKAKVIPPHTAADSAQHSPLVSAVLSLVPEVDSGTLDRIEQAGEGASLVQQKLATDIFMRRAASMDDAVGLAVWCAKKAAAGKLTAPLKASRLEKVEVDVESKPDPTPQLEATVMNIAKALGALPGWRIAGYGLPGEVVVVDSYGGLCSADAIGARVSLTDTCRIWSAVQKRKLTLLPTSS